MNKAKDSTHSVLDTNVERLTHLAEIIRPVLHFLSRLRQLRDQAEGRRGIKVTEAVKDDLRLFLRVINLAKTGISMNLLTFRLPTHVYRSDACPAGLGGYNNKGRAWRFPIPPNLQGRALIKLLERLGCAIGPRVDLKEGQLPAFSCILSITDSTTAEGWIKKSNFREEDDSDVSTWVKRELAREEAIL